MALCQQSSTVDEFINAGSVNSGNYGSRIAFRNSAVRGLGVTELKTQ